MSKIKTAANGSNTSAVNKLAVAKSLLNRQEVIKKFQLSANDSGSSSVQVALLTLVHINPLSEHLKIHRNDLHSKRGLIKMISRRRKHLDYLKKTNFELYKKLLSELDLRK